MKNLFSPGSAVTRIRRRLTSGLLALCLATGFISFSVTPAHAAGAIGVCFKSVKQNFNGYTYPISLNVSGTPAMVQALYNNVAYNVARLTLDIPGMNISYLLNGSTCLIWIVPANLQNYPLRVVINSSWSPGATTANIRWSGETPWFAPAGSGSYYSFANNAYCTQGC